MSRGCFCPQYTISHNTHLTLPIWCIYTPVLQHTARSFSHFTPTPLLFALDKVLPAHPHTAIQQTTRQQIRLQPHNYKGLSLVNYPRAILNSLVRTKQKKHHEPLINSLLLFAVASLSTGPANLNPTSSKPSPTSARQNGWANQQDDGQDLRVKRDAAVDAGSRCCWEDNNFV